MIFGYEYESGIKSFFERRQDFFREIDIEGSFAERIQHLKNKMSAKSNCKPTIVILGAGPAGLLRAIQSISNGNPIKIIESRPENAVGRINTVALTATTTMILQYCGIYQYLREKGLIYPPNKEGGVNIRLADLEHAMKVVLNQLCPESIIQYDSKVTKIASQSNKIKLEVESIDGAKSTLSEIDILVNAEGGHSTTNSLLGIKRTEVLPLIPVIAAIYRDTRPQISGMNSLWEYSRKSVAYIATTINYHLQFLFKFIMSRKFKEQFRGALILKTPKQNYLGCGFSNEINERLLFFKKTIREKKSALEKAQSTQEVESCRRELEIVEERYRTFAKYWINLSICHANMIALLSRFYGGPHFSMGGHRSLNNFEVVKIGADRADEYCKQIGQTSVLLAGDASATVDPTTALGCNTATQSSIDFLDFIWDYDKGVSQEKLLEEYANRMKKRVIYIHKKSKENRLLYRPDALASMNMR